MLMLRHADAPRNAGGERAERIESMLGRKAMLKCKWKIAARRATRTLGNPNDR